MATNKNNKMFNEMMMHSATKNSIPYASIDTPNGQFRIYPEMEEGYHGVFIAFVRDGQDVEQDICMAEIDPDDKSGNTFSVKVWSEPRCPYCGNWGVTGVDDFKTETKFFCDECENDFFMDNDTGEYSTRNRVPLKPFEEKEKEQE